MVKPIYFGPDFGYIVRILQHMEPVPCYKIASLTNKAYDCINWFSHSNISVHGTTHHVIPEEFQLFSKKVVFTTVL